MPCRANVEACRANVEACQSHVVGCLVKPMPSPCRGKCSQVPRDKDIFHALAFFLNAPRQGTFVLALGIFSHFFSMPRDKDMLANAEHFDVRSCLRRFFSPFLPKPLTKS
jgi:hypothetical protein